MGGGLWFSHQGHPLGTDSSKFLEPELNGVHRVALHNDSVCPGEESVVPSQYVSSVASMAVTYCSVPLVTGVLDNSGGSSVASTQGTYVGVIPL